MDIEELKIRFELSGSYKELILIDNEVARNNNAENLEYTTRGENCRKACNE